MGCGASGLSALALCAASPLPVDTPVPLWGGLSSGMSQIEVQRLYPAAKPSPETQDDSGYLTTLAVPLRGLYGEPALARFRFRNRRLAAVRLDVKSLKPGHRRENVRVARALIRDYTAAYKNAYDCNNNSFADTAALDCKWLDKGATVQLEYMDVAGQAPVLKVFFSPTADVGPDL